MNDFEASINTHKQNWSDRIAALEQETAACNTRLQMIQVETQQLRGAIQACNVFLAELNPSVQSLSKDE